LSVEVRRNTDCGGVHNGWNGDHSSSVGADGGGHERSEVASGIQGDSRSSVDLDVLHTNALQEGSSGITQLEAESSHILVASSTSRASLLCALSASSREPDSAADAVAVSIRDLTSGAALSVKRLSSRGAAQAHIALARGATSRALGASSSGRVEGVTVLA